MEHTPSQSPVALKPIRQVHFSYSIEWMKAAWALAYRNYKMALGMGLLASVLNLGVSRIPEVGGLLSMVFTVLFTPGFVLVSHDWANGRTPPFEKFFAVFKNTSLLLKLLPVLGISALLSASVTYGMEHLPTPTAITAVLTFVVTSLTLAFVNMCLLPALILHPDIRFEALFSRAFEGFRLNLPAMVLYTLLVGPVILLSVLLLLLPFVFVVIPSTVTVVYIVYASIFEGLDLEGFERKIDPEMVPVPAGDEPQIDPNKPS